MNAGFTSTRAKKSQPIYKHHIRIACDSQELIIYDKTYQLSENDLIMAYEALSSGAAYRGALRPG